MFIVQTEQKPVTWPVTVEIADDGGKTRKFEFTGTFRRLSDDERDLIAAEIKDEESPAVDGEDAGAWKETSVANIMKIMTGWTGVVDPDKKPIEFSRESLRAAVRSPSGLGLLRGINAAISEITLGARTKN